MENQNTEPIYGKVTVGFGTKDQHDIAVSDFVKSLYHGDRTVHVAKLVDGSYTVTVENLVSSGRAPHQTIRLGEESFVAMISGIMIYAQVTGLDFVKILSELQGEVKTLYAVSDNLKPFN